MNFDIYDNEEILITPCTNVEHLECGKFNDLKYPDIWNHFESIYISRCDAEKSKEVFQIIPYIILKNEFGNYFVLESKSGKMTLGISSHISKEYGYKNPLFRATFNILMDTVNVIDSMLSPMQHIGFIKDMSAENSHLGIILKGNCVGVKLVNKDYKRSHLYSKNELIDKYHKFEEWSKQIIDYLVDHNI